MSHGGVLGTSRKLHVKTAPAISDFKYNLLQGYLTDVP